MTTPPPDPREALAEVLTDILRERFGLLIPPDNPAYVARAMVDPLLASDALTRLLATREAEALERAAAELDALPSYRFEGGEDHYGSDRIHAYGRDDEAERIADWLRARAQEVRGG